MVPLLTVGLSVVAAVALLGTATISSRYWGEPGSMPFTALTATLGLTSATFAMGAVDPRAQLVGVPLLYCAVPVLWAVFTFEFTGRYDIGSLRRRFLLAAPAIYQSAGYVGFTVAGARVTGTPIGAVEVKTWFAVVTSVSGAAETVLMGLYIGMFLSLFCLLGLLLVATAVLMGQLARYEHLGLDVALVLSVSVVGPWLMLMTADTVQAIASLDPVGIGLAVAVTFVVSGGGLIASLGRYDLFAASPAAGAIGPDRILEDLSEPIVVVDHDERAIQLNPAARNVVGTDQHHIGRGIEALLGHDVASLEARGTIDVDGVNGHHQYEATVSEMTGQTGRKRGHAIVLRDVTGREVRQQRLEVLNRVLRHNLRNDLTAIRGRAEMLGTEGVDETVVRDVITETTDNLVALSDRAREVEQMLSAPVSETQSCDLATVVSRIVGDVTAEHDVAVTVTVPEGVTVDVDERILRPVVSNLVVNAILHHDRPNPAIEVSATVGAGTLPISLSVTDDGPGLPDHERAAVERGHEKALEHGTGLGLWVVKWGVARIGGHLSIQDNEPRGTVVDIRLPSAESGAADRRMGIASGERASRDVVSGRTTTGASGSPGSTGRGSRASE